jgi:CBS domain-containing protein
MRRSKKFLDKSRLTQARERGNVEFGSKIVETEGSVMSLSMANVVTISQTTTIKGAAETMTQRGFRRLPVVDPGTGRLLGIIGSSDIIDFLGGGEKFRLIAEKHEGNFLAAINEPVKEIMVKNVVTANRQTSIEEALRTIKNTRVGGLVIVDEEKRVIGIITERDFVFLLADKLVGKKVIEHMTRKVMTATPAMTLGDVAKAMVRNSFRRLPVVSRGQLVGILTTRMIIEFIGRNHVFNRIVENRVEEVLGTRCEAIMSRDVRTIGKNADLGEVASLLKKKKAGTVCIVENGGIHGILTERDVVLAL